MIAVLLFTLFCVSARAENPSAYEIYSKLLEESVDSSVRYSEGMAEWSLMRSGKSHDILKLVSPSSDTLDEMIQSLTKESRELFVQEFFMKEGRKWKAFLAEEKKKRDTPLASLSEETARRIFYGDFPGLGKDSLPSTFDKEWNFTFGNKGKARRFVHRFSSLVSAFNAPDGYWNCQGETPIKFLSILRAKSTCQTLLEEKFGSGGFSWAITFRTQKSYGDFEEMLRWVRQVLGFHYQFMDREFFSVIPTNLSSLNEEINLHFWKVFSFKPAYRMDMGISEPVSMRLINQFVMARIFSKDVSGMYGTPWNWKTPFSVPKAQKLAQRFGVSIETAEKAFFNMTRAAKFYGPEVLFPLGNWQKVSFLGSVKKRTLEALSRTFVEESAKVEGDEASRALQILDLRSDWLYASSILEDVESTLKPRLHGRIGEVLSYRSSSSGKRVVDANKIALGIEYTGRFPVETYVPGTVDSNGKKRKSILLSWDGEREELMQGLARELSLSLRGNGEIHKKAGGHGHGLGHTYTFFDGEARSWNVSWDGIRRKYDEMGNIVEASVSGGHLEVSSAKFVPKVWEIEAVYRALKKFEITPSHDLGGGGHINVDLAPFEGRPRAMARFLALFHQYQDIITMMFSGQAYFYPASGRLLEKLKDFRGSEEELKELLYNQRYFYSLPNAKTRYSPVNIVPYFQEVIPGEFLSEDVDQFNPTVSWRPRFRFVRDEEKRMELRFFHAPRDAFESALHIRFVRAMLHSAFNEDFPLEGSAPQKFDYIQNPQKAFARLNSLCQTLNLECHLYRPLFTEKYSGFIYIQSVQGMSPRQMDQAAARQMTELDDEVLKNDSVWGQANVSCEQEMQRLLGSDP